jgi:hypothetical protein
MAAADSDFHALWMQDLEYPARLDRVFADNIFTAGVLGSSSFEVTPSSPAALTVDVAAGVAVVEGADQANQGKYMVRKQTPETGLAIGAAPGSGQRNDLIVLEVRDPNATGPAGDDVRLLVVVGTPDVSPVDPTPPVTSLVLARVRVPAATGSIDASLIDDLRVQSDFQHPTGTAGLQDGAVTTVKIANGAVTNAKLRDSAARTVIGRATSTTGAPADIAVGADQVLGRIGTGNLAGSQVQTNMIADSAVSTVKIADIAITTAKIATGAVTSAKIGTNQVTASEIADGAVGATQLASSAVTNVKIANGAVTSAKIGTNQVTSSEIADGAVGATQLASSAVTNVKIANNAVTSAKIGSNQVTNSEIASSTILAGNIANNAVTSAKIASGAVTETELDTATGTGSIQSGFSGFVQLIRIGKTVFATGQIQRTGATTSLVTAFTIPTAFRPAANLNNVVPAAGSFEGQAIAVSTAGAYSFVIVQQTAIYGISNVWRTP